MKQTIILSFFLILSCYSIGQPPNGNQQVPTTNNQFGVSRNATNSSNGYLNIQTNQESNSLLKMDSVHLKVDQKLEEKSSFEEVEDMEGISSLDQTTKYFSAFSLIRQQSKLNRFQRTPLPAEQAEMDAKVKQLGLVSPQSWEYKLAFYAAGNYQLERGSAIEQAFRLNPENTEVQKQYFSYQYMKGDTLQAANVLSTMVLDEQISLSVERYTSDVLTSCAMNSTLITHGFEDTYGALFNQFCHHQRPDVRVVSLDFLQSPQYRDQLAKDGFVLPKSTKIDVAYLNQFCYLNANESLFLSVTIPKNYLDPLAKKLYPVGLTFQYVDTPPEDLPARQENLWFYQLNKFGLTEGEERSKFAMNYMPMLMYLEKKYEVEGNEVLLLQIRQSIDFILGKKSIKKLGN